MIVVFAGDMYSFKTSCCGYFIFQLFHLAVNFNITEWWLWVIEF